MAGAGLIHSKPADTPPAPAAASPGQLRWRCRRGMRELDVLLERFAERALPGATAAERHAFEQLLGLPDPVLAGYLLGGMTPRERPLAQVVRLIRASGGRP